MGIKLHDTRLIDSNGQHLYIFHCPGCNGGHPFYVPMWKWNGSFESPTFSPSLLCNKDNPQSRCHSFVNNGRIQFLNDCYHSLKGQTVEIPDWHDQE